MRFPTSRILVAALIGFFSAAIAFADAAAGGSSDSPTGPDAAVTVPTNPDHVLHPQDLLRIQVFQEDDINRQCDGVEVSAESTITLPLIGVMNVRGKTIRETQALIRKLYDRDYIVNPQVSVIVLKYAERTVNVIGSVTKQGRIEFPPQRDLTIVDAIALAGGQTRLADLEHVKLTRKDADGTPQVTEVNVDAMMKRNGGTPVLLLPDDIIYVPERVL